MTDADITTDCCIVGGGPAGLMLGLLLARSAVNVVVIEKHADFLRDFRGDTIHPSTMQILHELGYLEEFLKLPHQPVPRLVAQFADLAIPIADFAHLPVPAKFIAMMPQWDFLNFLAGKARQYPGFRLLMQTEATQLIEDRTKVVGIDAQSSESLIHIRSSLVVAADGRDSVVRRQSGLRVDVFGAPMDVLWFRLSRQSGDTDQTQGRFIAGRIFIMLNRGTYWQCAFVIPKGFNERIRDHGLDAFQTDVAGLLPFEKSRVLELNDWRDVKLLTVQLNRMPTWWRDGLLCIGDAAHAMSPVAGVGVNLAVQDAVAASNLLGDALRNQRLAPEHLASVQRRRDWPTRLTQRLQMAIQKTVIAPALAENGVLRPPLALRAIGRIPGLNRLPARLIGLGVRPEHVRTRAVGPN